MGVIAKDKNQLKLYYNSKNSIGKQTQGYVESIETPLLSVDTSKENVTGTQWSEIARGLDLKIAQLVDTSHPDFIEEYGDTELVMEDSGWLKILDKHPEFVRKPILLKGSEFHMIETPSEVVAFIEPDSAGLDKPYNK